MIEKFSKIFEGLEKAFGTYEIQSQNSNGKAVGKAKLIHEPRTLQTWQDHLSGKKRWASFLLTNTINVGGDVLILIFIHLTIKILYKRLEKLNILL